MPYSSVLLGRGKLKTFIFALLFLYIGFFNNSVIFSQDSQETGQGSDNQSAVSGAQSPADPYRAREQNLTFGGTNDENIPVNNTASGLSAWAFVRMALILMLAAAAVYGIVFFLKKANKKKTSSDPFLKILASSHLGANRYAQIVSVGNKAWLLGTSEGGVNLIAEIDDPDILNAMQLEESKKSEESIFKIPNFIEMLRRLGSRAESQAPSADEITKRRNRIRER